MYKNMIVIVLLLVQFAWSVRITRTEGDESKCYVQFSHIPALEKIGAFSVTIRLVNEDVVSSISTDAPTNGAWSQVKPVLQRKGNLIEILCVGPAMINSMISDTLEMFHLSLEVSGKATAGNHTANIIDSIWFTQCLNTSGNTIIPNIEHTTETMKQRAKDFNHSQSVQYRGFGRIHSLTYNLGSAQMVKAWVVDAKGRVLTKLTDKKEEPGMHALRWPEKNQQIAAGTYFIQLEINNFTYNKKVSYYK